MRQELDSKLIFFDQFCFDFLKLFGVSNLEVLNEQTLAEISRNIFRGVTLSMRNQQTGSREVKLKNISKPTFTLQKQDINVDDMNPLEFEERPMTVLMGYREHLPDLNCYQAHRDISLDQADLSRRLLSSNHSMNLIKARQDR